MDLSETEARIENNLEICVGPKVASASLKNLDMPNLASMEAEVKSEIDKKGSFAFTVSFDILPQETPEFLEWATNSNVKYSLKYEEKLGCFVVFENTRDIVEFRLLWPQDGREE